MATTVNDVKNRLEMLGYTASQLDETSLTFLLDAVESEVLNKCNISTIPNGLDSIVTDAVAGRFLKQKHDTGQLTGYDFTTPIQSITEGDASVSYKTAESPESAFVAYITDMAELPIEILVKYRRLAW